MRSAQEVTPVQRQMAADMTRDFVQKLKEKGMEIVPVPNKRPFQERMEVVYKQFEDKIGKDLIAAVLNGQ
jgi:TRAP-type C4-dicarboxylate transport system substrate-binding protein